MNQLLANGKHAKKAAVIPLVDVYIGTLFAMIMILVQMIAVLQLVELL
jgi:hypothetical protein